MIANKNLSIVRNCITLVDLLTVNHDILCVDVKISLTADHQALSLKHMLSLNFV